MMTPDGGLQRDLVPVNAVIGFLKRDRRWPSVLSELRYSLTMIEQPVSAPGIGTAEVDVICLSSNRNHAILWECKAGRTVDEKQARVYSALTPEDIQRTGNITFPDPRSASVEVAYCCLQGDWSAVVNALRGLNLSFPVVSLGEEAGLASGQFQDGELTKRFGAGVALPPLEEVPRFLIANTHTPKWQLARALFATIVSILRKTTRFSLRLLLEETFPDWSSMGTDLRRYLQSTARDILVDLCGNELKGFARMVRAAHTPNEPLVEFTVDVLGQDASMRTRTFQRLARLAYGYIERTREERAYEPAREVETLWLPGLEPD
jgi:hypothetical protein